MCLKIHPVLSMIWITYCTNTVYEQVWGWAWGSLCLIKFLMQAAPLFSLHCACIIQQVTAEEADLQNTAPLSDNLIDFTDPTPVVSVRVCDIY